MSHSLLTVKTLAAVGHNSGTSDEEVLLDQDNEELSDEVNHEDGNLCEFLIGRSEVSENSNSNEDPDCTDDLKKFEKIII